MKQEKFSFNGINVYFIKTMDFKKVKVRMSFRSPIVKKNITINNFLSRMLIYSTKKYPTQRLFLIELQNLYNMSIGYDNYFRGNYLFNDFSLSIIGDRYSEKGNLTAGISLFLDALFKPNVTSQKFDNKSFDIIYSRVQENINSAKEDKDTYAIRRTKQIMGSKEVYSYNIEGYKEDLDKITPSNLYNYYKKWLNNVILDIYVVGDFDAEEIKSLLKEKILINVNRKTNVPLIFNHKKISKRNKKHFELDDVTQAKLVTMCKLEDLSLYERQYVMPLYNIILGGTPTSKLFKTVREKYSLCYTVRSKIDLSSNIMYIRAGINKEKYDKALKIIKKMMIEMINGDIENARLEEAKTLIIENNKKISDSLNSIIDQYETINLFDYDDVETENKKITEVTIDDIKKGATKVKLDTIYLLHGGDEYGNN